MRTISPNTPMGGPSNPCWGLDPNYLKSIEDRCVIPKPPTASVTPSPTAPPTIIDFCGTADMMNGTLSPAAKMIIAAGEAAAKVGTTVEGATRR